MRISQKKRFIANSSVALLAVILTGVTSYHYGFTNGQKSQKAQQPKAVSANEVFDNAASYFRRSITGTITDIKGTELTIKQSNGKTQQVSITKQTTVGQGDKEVSSKELKANQHIYVVLDQTNRTQATRITIK